jgi:hypothetical protein
LHENPHAPALHVAVAFATPVVQATGEPYAPLPLHVSRLLPEHVVWPGAHDPAHAPLTHVWFTHTAGEPYVPLDWHVSTPLPEHVVWFGPHEPVHVPLTHVWFEHAVPTVHVPEALHVSGWFMVEQLS